MRKVCEVYLVSSSVTDERGVELTFPVSQYEMMDAFEQIHTKSPGDVYWQVDEFYCFDYLAPHLDESMSIFEFNSLTEQLSKLDERQETALEGLLQMQVKNHMQENSGPITVQELMMLAHNVDHCHVLADVHTDTELGKFCADNDFLPELTALPDSVYALLDYAKIGKQMREDESGVFTPHGYVVRTEELQPLPDFEPQREIFYMLRLTLMNHENEQKTAVLDLPATEQRMQEVQKELDAPEWFDAQFTGCDAMRIMVLMPVSGSPAKSVQRSQHAMVQAAATHRWCRSQTKSTVSSAISSTASRKTAATAVDIKKILHTRLQL